MNEVVLTNKNFTFEVEKCDIPVLVDFWATWCGPCQMLAPIISEIADENVGKIKVCKVNVDEEMELAEQFNVESIPTVLCFKNGKLTKKSIGYCSKQEILDLLK